VAHSLIAPSCERAHAPRDWSHLGGIDAAQDLPRLHDRHARLPRHIRGERHRLRLEKRIPRVTERDESTSEVKVNNVSAPADRVAEGDILVVDSHKRIEDLIEKDAE
jgi:hypothetical protein